MIDMPTKERILYAALNLFAEKGYDGVGVDLIEENAGLTVYFEVPNKKGNVWPEKVL